MRDGRQSHVGWIRGDSTWSVQAQRWPGPAHDRQRHLPDALSTARYDDGLAGLPLALPRRRADTTHVYHQYVVRSPARDLLREHLRAAAIGTGIHYPVPVHLQPAYRGRLAEFPAGLPETTRAAGEILSLPIYPELSEAAVRRVIQEVNRFYG